MAEDEIVKHSKAIYKAWKDPHTSWTHKVKEIILEIAIITFAISLSVWLHNWSDSLKERKEERAFLKGLKVDLQGTIENATKSKKAYELCLNGFTYFMNANQIGSYSQDSVDHYNKIFFNPVELDAHVNRYEGLKGSGKFSIIENQDLLNDIINIHERVIPYVASRDNGFAKIQERIRNQFEDNVTLKLTGVRAVVEEKFVLSPRMLMMFEASREFAMEGKQAQDTCIVKCQEVMAAIDKELGKN